MADLAEAESTEAPATEGKPTKAAPKPAAAKPEAKPEPKAAPKAPAKPKTADERAADAAQARESNIEKFARKMNTDAEKDGVEVTAPEAERRAKPGPKPGSKRAPKPEPEATDDDAPEPAAQANPTPREKLAAAKKPQGKPEAGAVEGDEEPGEQVDEDGDGDGDGTAPEPRSVHQLKAKARLRHGDVDKAVRLAFGDLKPEEFQDAKEALARKLGVSSKEWADFRRFQKDEQGKSKALESRAIELSQRLRADFGPMIEARKAYAAKDYPKALELAFPGETPDAFSRKMLHQHLSQDPEKVRLRQELDELRNKVEQGQKPQEPDAKALQSAALRREADRAHELLTQSDDAEIAHFATKRKFVQRVVELRGEHYDPQSKTTIPFQVAADMARNELKQGLEEWRVPNASGAAAPSSESPGLAGNEPVRSSPRARSPNPSLAAQAGGSTRSLSREERIQAYAARMQ